MRNHNIQVGKLSKFIIHHSMLHQRLNYSSYPLRSCGEFKVMDACVQLHGGYGYMWEYPVTRAWANARLQRIQGGTNEIMKESISRSL